LDEYFANEGKAEPIVITIPKGAYVAAFEPRAVPPLLMDHVESPVPLVSEAKSAIVERSKPAIFPWAPFFFGTTVLFMVLAAWFFMRPRESVPTPSVEKTLAPSKPLWGELFDKDHETFVVCADSALVLLQELIKRPISLAEYINRNYSATSQKLPPEVQTLLRILPQRQYTNISDVRLVQAILQLNDEYRGRSVVRSARNVELIDFKNGNFVLLGSRRSTPWVELFEPSLNFHFVYDGKLLRTGFSNVKPQKGEKSVYWIEGSSTQLDKTYGVIAFLPNLNRNGNVLMIQGATGEGTEAAGEYITNPESLSHLLKTIHAIDNDHLRYFEVLLKSGTIAGTPKDAEIISYRLLPAGR